MRSRPTLAVLGDGWYESEAQTRAGMVTELRRARRRFAARPVRVLALTALLTAGILYRVTHKERRYPAEVVLALTEGSMTGQRAGVPADQLRTYVTSVLMSDAKLLEVIEKHDLIPLRRRLGPQYAVEELRSQIEVEIWRNSFIYYHEWDAQARKSARIGVTVYDSDPERAIAVAQDVARVVIESHDAQRTQITGAVARELRIAREMLQDRLRDLTSEVVIKQTALAEAQRRGNKPLVAVLHVELTALDATVKQQEDQLQLILHSPEQLADHIAAAGLDVTLSVVDERRPDRSEPTALELVIVGVIVGLGALLVSSLVLGAFDTRIHDIDDLDRLGIPVLGHVPAYRGDRIGSLHARFSERGANG